MHLLRSSTEGPRRPAAAAAAAAAAGAPPGRGMGSSSQEISRRQALRLSSVAASPAAPSRRQIVRAPTSRGKAQLCSKPRPAGPRRTSARPRRHRECAGAQHGRCAAAPPRTLGSPRPLARVGVHPTRLLDVDEGDGIGGHALDAEAPHSTHAAGRQALVAVGTCPPCHPARRTPTCTGPAYPHPTPCAYRVCKPTGYVCQQGMSANRACKPNGSWFQGTSAHVLTRRRTPPRTIAPRLGNSCAATLPSRQPTP
jgi:hypothetical protein